MDELQAAELRARVALMRELGVVRWGEILLGPAPPPPPVEKAEKSDPRHPDEIAWNEWCARALRATGAPVPPWPGPGHRSPV